MNGRGTALAGVLSLLAGCGERAPAPPPLEVAPSEALEAQGEEFRRQVIEVTGGVHVAVGFGLANSILLEGEDGVVVVDVMENVETGAAVNAEFRRIAAGRPLRAIVYTHNHVDHVLGASAFVAPGETPQILAHELLNRRLDEVLAEFRPVLGRRGDRMLGTYLSGDALINLGIGPSIDLRPDSLPSLLRPTRTFDKELDVEIAGLRLRLEHAPGETEDHLFVWLPDRNVLLPGDNFYRAFPNLYTIRGTPYRNPRVWADSLDRMRDLPVEHLVPSHTRPLSGAPGIHRALTDYRDAIRFVYDQSVRAINAGLTPDELAEHVRLPPHLAASPFLQEFYGKASWSARGIFDGSLGWFDGNPSALLPLPPMAHAQRMAALAGGEEALVRAVTEASAAGDHQWVLQLSDHALRLRPGERSVVDARVQALTALGEAESNPNARHYYLTSALELRGLRLPEPIARATPEILGQFPLSAFFHALAVNLDARRSADEDLKVGFEFTDTGEAWTAWVRRGVLEARPRLLPDLDLRVRMPAQVFKELLARLRNPAVTLAREVEMEQGNRLELARFLRLFQPPES